MQLQNKVTCMKYKDIYRAAVLSNQVYMNPRTYIWKNPKSHYISKNNVDVFITRFDQNLHDSSLYVVFKGSSSVRDLLVSASAISEKKHDIMHNAYLKKYMSVHKDINRIIKPMLKDYKYLIYGGHSAGGSIGAVASIFNYFLSDIHKDNHISCISFGAPRCINKDMSTFFENNIDHIGIEHCYDIIPHIPLHRDLVTLPNKLIIGSKEQDNPLEIYENHSAAKYRTLIEDLTINCESPLSEPFSCQIQPSTAASHDDMIS